MLLLSVCPRETIQKLGSTMQLVSFYFVQRPIFVNLESRLHFSPLKTWRLHMFGLITCQRLHGRGVHLIERPQLLLGAASQVFVQLSRQRRWKKDINCPARYGSALVAGSCHHPPSLIGVYKGHMAWEGAAVPARPTLTHKAALLPVGRRWMRCVEPPAAVVPAGSGRRRTRQRRPRSLRSMENDPDRCSLPPAPSLSDRGPIRSKEVGHL